MFRKTVAAAAVSFALVSFAVPASAAKTQALYLVQTSADCEAASFEISASSAGEQPCASVPRIMHEGQGVPADGESFRTTRKLALRLDVNRRITGTFYLSGSFLVGVTPDSPASAANYAPGKVAADLRIKANTTTIGTVRVAGDSTPGAPVGQAFSFAVPKSLKNVAITKLTVDVTWITCVSPGCYVGVGGASASTLSLPVR